MSGTRGLWWEVSLVMSLEEVAESFCLSSVVSPGLGSEVDMLLTRLS